MSTRTEIVSQSVGKGFDPESFRETGTEDMTMYSAHLGLDLQGRDAIAEALAKKFPDVRPTFEIHGEPIEQGDFVVVFYRATLGSGEQREICAVYRFTTGDKISGVWTMKA